MTTDTTPPCANCQRLQAQVDALEARVRRPRGRSSPSCSGNSPRPARIPRPPPSRRPPTSSSRPSRRRRRVRSGAASADNPATPSTNASAFPPEIDQRCVGRLSPRPLSLLRRITCSPCRRSRPESSSRSTSTTCRWRSRSIAVIRGGALTVRSSSRPRSPSAIERGGLVGPRLTTVIAYLKGVCHASFSTVRKFLRDVVGLTISRGQLAKIIAKVSRALEQPYEELLTTSARTGAAQRR